MTCEITHAIQQLLFHAILCMHAYSLEFQTLAPEREGFGTSAVQNLCSRNAIYCTRQRVWLSCINYTV